VTSSSGRLHLNSAAHKLGSLARVQLRPTNDYSPLLSEQQQSKGHLPIICSRVSRPLFICLQLVLTHETTSRRVFKALPRRRDATSRPVIVSNRLIFLSNLSLKISIYKMPIVEPGLKLDFSDVLISPRGSNLNSRSQVSLTRSFQFRAGGQHYTGIPIIASNMDTVGTFEMAKALYPHSLFTTVHKHYSVEEWVKFANENQEVLSNLAISQGIGEADQEKVNEVLSKVPQIGYICIDVANGYSQNFVEVIETTRRKYPTKTIIAGNVVTGEMVEVLLMAGADIVKVGIGPGSVCTTRKKTGVGSPQLSAVLECAEAAHGLDGHIISDGGCTVPGDVCKAFGAGADFVMLGGMLAGHDQCPGELQSDDNGKKFKLFYGMSSKLAQEKYNSGLASYRASEGKVVRVPYRGDVSTTVQDILGGLRSACTYTGSSELKELPRNTRFFRVSQQTNEVYATSEVAM